MIQRQIHSLSIVNVMGRICSGLELELEQELELERRAGTQQCNFHQVLFKTGDNRVIVKNTSHSSELDT